eukprot:TRINITY_DN3941_c0_g1_i4.p1 TRINITY_DN3941_c0_g1~~TRINITY_DN3941_c0_g1_i4.p1  ORF type:complete len:1017 (+),score=200.14 TRINITY_DN3941_c0_g1_i4:47-3097(+)
MAAPPELLCLFGPPLPPLNSTNTNTNTNTNTRLSDTEIKRRVLDSYAIIHVTIRQTPAPLRRILFQHNSESAQQSQSESPSPSFLTVALGLTSYTLYHITLSQQRLSSHELFSLLNKYTFEWNFRATIVPIPHTLQPVRALLLPKSDLQSHDSPSNNSLWLAADLSSAPCCMSISQWLLTKREFPVLAFCRAALHLIAAFHRLKISPTTVTNTHTHHRFPLVLALGLTPSRVHLHITQNHNKVGLFVSQLAFPPHLWGNYGLDLLPRYAPLQQEIEATLQNAETRKEIGAAHEKLHRLALRFDLRALGSLLFEVMPYSRHYPSLKAIANQLVSCLEDNEYKVLHTATRALQATLSMNRSLNMGSSESLFTPTLTNEGRNPHLANSPSALVFNELAEYSIPGLFGHQLVAQWMHGLNALSLRKAEIAYESFSSIMEHAPSHPLITISLWLVLALYPALVHSVARTHRHLAFMNPIIPENTSSQPTPPYTSEIQTAIRRIRSSLKDEKMRTLVTVIDGLLVLYRPYNSLPAEFNKDKTEQSKESDRSEEFVDESHHAAEDFLAEGRTAVPSSFDSLVVWVAAETLLAAPLSKKSFSHACRVVYALRIILHDSLAPHVTPQAKAQAQQLMRDTLSRAASAPTLRVTLVDERESLRMDLIEPSILPWPVLYDTLARALQRVPCIALDNLSPSSDDVSTILVDNIRLHYTLAAAYGSIPSLFRHARYMMHIRKNHASTRRLWIDATTALHDTHAAHYGHPESQAYTACRLQAAAHTMARDDGESFGNLIRFLESHASSLAAKSFSCANSTALSILCFSPSSPLLPDNHHPHDLASVEGLKDHVQDVLKIDKDHVGILALSVMLAPSVMDKIYWLEVAHLSGLNEAALVLARYYASVSDWSPCLRWYMLATTSGNIDACYELAYLLEFNAGIRPQIGDFPGGHAALALRYYRLGAESGSVDCIYRLAVAYEAGHLGAHVDMIKANYYYDEGAAMGHEGCVYALHRLGNASHSNARIASEIGT